MFSNNLCRIEAAFKWPYLVLGMAKWTKWMDAASAETASTLALMGPSSLDIAYQLSFTAYAILHIAHALSERARRGRPH